MPRAGTHRPSDRRSRGLKLTETRLSRPGTFHSTAHCAMRAVEAAGSVTEACTRAPLSRRGPKVGLHCVLARPTAGPNAPKAHVDDRVDEAQEQAQGHLDLTRQRRWVYDGNNELLDKAARVFWHAASATEPILKWGQRAHPAGKLEQDTPQHSGKVHPGNPAPARRQQTAEDDEDDERQVGEDDEVCDGSEEHGGNRSHLAD